MARSAGNKRRKGRMYFETMGEQHQLGFNAVFGNREKGRIFLVESGERHR
jgi:hypothetical protein